MAIIYTYPRLINLDDTDLLIVSDSSAKRKPTMSVKLGDLATFINDKVDVGVTSIIPGSGITVDQPTGDVTISATGGVGGSGTTNQLTKWFSSNTVTDSVIYDDGINVGIGTTSPGNKLDVISSAGTGPVGYFRNTGTGRGLLVRTDSDAVGAEILSLFSGSSYKFYFGRDGNLGIGTINPTNKLHVEDGITKLDSKSATSLPLGLYSNFGNTGLAIFADDPIANSGYINVDSTGTSGNNEIGMNFAVDGFSSADVKLSLLNTGQLKAHSYGSGLFTGTATNNLAVDANGNIIEESTAGGGSGNASTIDFLSPGYQVTLYMENITPGSPDFGQAFAQPQGIYFRRQSAAATTQGGMPWNIYYNQYSPSLDPGYDAGFGCGSQTMCALVMLEESTADINLLNGGSTVMTGQFVTNSQDLSALNSLRLPLAMRIDNGGASPGNGTIRFTLIEATNSAPNPVDDAVCLPSTVSVYFRDTTLTSSKMGRPPFNLLWAGKDTRFAQYQNAGAAYTGSLDYVFTGNGSGTITRKYELFFQDEINSNSRCSYLKVTDGRVIFQDLPTVDPVSKGVVWNDAGTLKISLG